jgi:hypothetical protein
MWSSVLNLNIHYWFCPEPDMSSPHPTSLVSEDNFKYDPLMGGLVFGFNRRWGIS